MKKLEVLDFQYLNLLGHFNNMLRGTYKEIIDKIGYSNHINMPIAFDGNKILMISWCDHYDNMYMFKTFEIYTTKNFKLVYKYDIINPNDSNERFIDNTRTTNLHNKLISRSTINLLNRLKSNINNNNTYVKMNYQARQMIIFSKLINKTVKRYDPYGLLEDT